MGADDYPNGPFVAVTVEPPFHGRILAWEDGRRDARLLWECEHDHPAGPEAAACAGREIGRSGRT